MAKVAKKKTVDNGLAYEFCIKNADILKRVHFGSFEVIKTAKGIMFKNYAGYHVFTTPYAVGGGGEPRHTSLYAWLDELIETHEAAQGHFDDPFGDAVRDDGTPILVRDIYDQAKIITETNLTRPMTVFLDINSAIDEANKYIKWLHDMQEKLAEAMQSTVASEDEAVKDDAIERERAFSAEVISETMSEEDIRTDA